MSQHSVPNTIDESPSHSVINASIAFQRNLPLDPDSKIPVRFSLDGSNMYLHDQFTFVPNNCDDTMGDERRMFGRPSREPGKSVRAYAGPGRGPDGTIVPTIVSGSFEIHRLRPEFSRITMEAVALREEDCPEKGWTTWSGPVKVSRALTDVP
jgi:hypothetical protein